MFTLFDSLYAHAYLLTCAFSPKHVHLSCVLINLLAYLLQHSFSHWSTHFYLNS